MLTLSEIKGVGSATIKKLQELDIKSVFELFSFLPAKYIDLRAPVSVTDAQTGSLELFEGRVEKISSVSPRGKRAFSVSFSDNLAKNNRIFFNVTFYNMPFLHDSFAVGDEYRLLGRLSDDHGKFSIANPQIEKADKISKLQGIFTVYPLKNIIGQNAFKNIVKSALEDALRAKYEGKFARINRDLIDAFYRLHIPDSIDDVNDAYDTLASLDIAIVLSIYRKLRNSAQKSRKVFYNSRNFRIEDYTNILPFSPTLTQVNAFGEILNDMYSDTNMSRIVSGDVGSGKTAVAFFAMAACALGGRQCALMAPTDILARQHFAKFEKVAEKLNITCAVLTSKMSLAEKRAVYDGLADGSISCVIGTQSLISENTEYKQLTLAVIDEQHKFGVNERRILESKGAVDVLSMTATPIPRSMALTFYDDIAISYIQKRENASVNIKTSVVNSVEEGVQNIVAACGLGKQAFIVCPCIVDAEGNDLMSIESFIRDYSKYFDGLDIRVLHGKMSAEDKAKAMSDFADGKIQALVATTVVEVGIDTLASEILILGADRFGLASLHQLRGRVGRDGSLAHCYVCAEHASDKALERLDIFCNHNDGQYLAEADFAMRGAGDFIGTRQSGISTTPIFGLKMSADILKSAKAYADKNLGEFTLSELTALTRRSKSRVDAFLNDLNKVTLNS